MVEYFDLKYNINLKLKGLDGQPCLVVNKRDQQIVLPCSLCHEASLPKDFTKDTRKMRDLQAYKVNGPEQRFYRISSLINKLQENEVMNEWGINVNTTFTQLKGKKLYPPKVLDGNGNQADFKDYEKGEIRHSQPVKLSYQSWVLVYSKFDYDNANLMFESLQKAQGRYGIKVEEPQWIEVPDGRDPKYFIDAIKTDMDPKHTLIALIVIQRREHKKGIKALLDKAGVPSQFILSETIKRAKITVYGNVLKQINAKLKLDLYRIRIPLRNVMIIGVDAVNEGRGSILGMTASYS